MEARWLMCVVAALVAVGGCASVATGPADDPVTDRDGGAVTTGVTEGSLVPDDRSGRTVTVVEVVDGDTLDVRYPNGTEDTVRLLGVDTPEVRGENDPGEFEGVPDSSAGRDCLRSAGADASAATKARLAGAEIRLFLDPGSDRRDRYGRLLAYVVHDGRNVNYWLVARGDARVYDTAFSYRTAFDDAERAARDRGIGVWDCRDTTASRTSAAAADQPLPVAQIHADAAGNDHGNLNDEYVVFRNRGTGPLDLGGWTVTDTADRASAFPPEATLGAGDALPLHAGPGTDGDGHCYWGSDAAIWNNGGDTVTVFDGDGRRVLSASY